MKKLLMNTLLCTAVLAGSLTLGGCGDAADDARAAERREERRAEREREEAEREAAEREETERDSDKDRDKDAEGKPETSEESEAEVSYVEYEIEGIRSLFHEGRAWVEYSENGNKMLGLIDTEGNLIFSAASADTFSEMQGGSAYVRLKDESAYIFIDQDGNETGRLEDTDTDTYRLLGSYYGKYFVENKHATMTENTTVYNIVNETGEILDSKEAASGWITGTELDLDAIIYDKVNDLVINLDTGTIFDFDERAYLESRYGDPVMGRVMLFLSLSDFRDAETLSAAMETKAQAWINFWEAWKVNYNNEEYVYAAFTNENYYADYTYDYYFAGYYDDYYYYGYCDYYHDHYGYTNKVWVVDSDYNLVTEFSFPEGITAALHNYKDGYFPATIRGADGKDYVTVVDTDGNFLYEPIQIDPQGQLISDRDKYTQYEGCLFVRSSGGGWNVITPDGEMLDEEDDLGSLPADITADFDLGRSNRAYGISEGFKVGYRNGNYFVSLDNSTVIHNVRVAQQ